MQNQSYAISRVINDISKAKVKANTPFNVKMAIKSKLTKIGNWQVILQNTEGEVNFLVLRRDH